jgi:two-component system, OmpR family, phosphate regulon sensor histidine kinase PhoR
MKGDTPPMESKTTARIRRQGQNLSLTGVIVMLSVGVLVPVLLSTTVGIITLALGENSNPIVIGVLVISFTAAAVGSALIATLLLGMKARTARLQADLLANVSHDLRTPLSAIRMYAQTLHMGRLKDNPKEAQESLLTIVRETEWLEAMIDRVLTWRAASKDRDLLQLKAEPLREAAEEAVQRFSKMLAPGEVELTSEFESTSPVLHDRRSISAAVLNLLINAYKYTGAQKKISVSVQDRKDQVILSVKDNGIGIPENELHRIFEPFYRIDSRLRAKSSGAGLGLAIVQHIVKSHRGEVFVESKEGEGSRFSIVLSVARTEEQRS